MKRLALVGVCLASLSGNASPHSNGLTIAVIQIVAPIGAGGLGDVYRATDSRLKRSVRARRHVILGDLVTVFSQQAGDNRIDFSCELYRRYLRAHLSA